MLPGPRPPACGCHALLNWDLATAWSWETPGIHVPQAGCGSMRSQHHRCGDPCLPPALPPLLVARLSAARRCHLKLRPKPWILSPGPAGTQGSTCLTTAGPTQQPTLGRATTPSCRAASPSALSPGRACCCGQAGMRLRSGPSWARPWPPSQVGRRAGAGLPCTPRCSRAQAAGLVRASGFRHRQAQAGAHKLGALAVACRAARGGECHSRRSATVKTQSPLAPGAERPLLRPAEQLKVSGVNLTFNTQEEWGALASHGFLQRTGIQYHWCGRVLGALLTPACAPLVQQRAARPCTLCLAWWSAMLQPVL